MIEFTNPTVVIMRGPSGSGKSTFALNFFRDPVICSADSYFIQPDGKYDYQREKIQEAHRQCWKSFQQALEDRSTPIVIDNTNTQKWECKRYIEEAQRQGYDVVIYRMKPTVTFLERNTHGVPPEIVQKMIDRMESIDGEKYVFHVYGDKYEIAPL